MDVRRRGGVWPWRARFAAGALVVGLCAVAPDARGDLIASPAPCTGAHRGDACDGAGAEPGVCRPVTCGDSSRFWRSAKGADECLACVVPPDPAVNDGSGGAATTSATATAPPEPESEAPRSLSAPATAVRVGVILVGLLGIVRAIALAMRGKRKRKP